MQCLMYGLYCGNKPISGNSGSADAAPFNVPGKGLYAEVTGFRFINANFQIFNSSQSLPRGTSEVHGVVL